MAVQWLPKVFEIQNLIQRWTCWRSVQRQKKKPSHIVSNNRQVMKVKLFEGILNLSYNSQVMKM